VAVGISDEEIEAAKDTDESPTGVIAEEVLAPITFVPSFDASFESFSSDELLLPLSSLLSS